MNYEDKTNRWIAIEVAKRLGKRVSTVTEFYDGDGCVVYPHSNQINFDPCNKPSDAWGIIVGNGISIMRTEGSSGDLWTCGLANFHDGMWSFDNEITGEYVDFETYGENPLRAAMICFLKMKDAEK